MKHLAALSRETPLQKSRNPVTDKHVDGAQSTPLIKLRHRALMAKFDMLKPVSGLYSFIRPGLEPSKVVMMFS